MLANHEPMDRIGFFMVLGSPFNGRPRPTFTGLGIF